MVSGNLTLRSLLSDVFNVQDSIPKGALGQWAWASGPGSGGHGCTYRRVDRLSLSHSLFFSLSVISHIYIANWLFKNKNEEPLIFWLHLFTKQARLNLSVV